jgi:hypothetical protein
MDLLRRCAGVDGLYEDGEGKEAEKRQLLALETGAGSSIGAVCTPESGTLRSFPS